MGSYLLRTEKEKRHFFQETSKYRKGIPLYYPWKICKSLPEYLISQGALSLSSNYNTEHINIPRKKRQIFNRAPNIVSAPRLFTIQSISNSQSKTHLSTSFLQSSSQWLLSQMSVIFLERQKQKQFSIPPLCLIRLKSCNCIEIKTLFIHISEKTTPSYLSNLLI